MIICVNVERNTKEQMDELIRKGEYRDYSELISLALGDHPKAAIDDQVKSGHREKA